MNGFGPDIDWTRMPVVDTGGFWVAIDWTGLPFAVTYRAVYTEAEFRSAIPGDGYRVEYWADERVFDVNDGLREWISVDGKLAAVAAGADDGAELAERFKMPLLAIQALAKERERARK